MRVRGTVRAVAPVGAMLLAASCGDDDNGDKADGSGKAGEELTRIDVGVVPVVDALIADL